jgi:hypothetical protein
MARMARGLKSEEGSSSFLKKRTKKLLRIGLGLSDYARPSPQSFLLLFS